MFGDPERVDVVGADAERGAFVSPVLLRADGDAAEPHDVEAFGPVSTLTEPYAGIQRGDASVVVSTATSTGSKAGRFQIR